MIAIKSAAEIAEIVSNIEAELDCLGWLATGDQPCAFNVEATGSLPNGWVKLASDGGEIFGDSERVLDALKSENGDGEFGECFATLDFTDKSPSSSRDWPENLIESEQLEEGTTNDNPSTLLTIGTNEGIRFVAGWNGVSECALENWINSGELFAETRESALTSV